MLSPEKDKHILVVDDIKSDSMLLERMLNNGGFSVITTDDGEKGLESAQKNTPSLILLDINMSPMDGYTLCKLIKKEPKLAEIPIIFISANNETLDKVQGFKNGGVDYITKPLQSEEVLARVTVHIENHKLQHQLRKSIQELEQTLSEVKQLKGLLPICAGCKNIRDDKGYWKCIESYIMDHSEAEFSHALCPSCLESIYPDLEFPEKKEPE